MGYLCDFCGEQRSMVYCRSDAACLCLSCDRNVHSANALSRRHSRTLVCERCNLQPAFVRCVEESLSLCQNCDWMGHGGSNSGSTHKRQSVNCYSGCPSAVELSSIWSFLLDQGMGSMSITDNNLANSKAPSGSNNGQDLSIDAKGLENVNNSNFWEGSSMPQLDNKLDNANQPIESTKSTLSKRFLTCWKLGLSFKGLKDSSTFNPWLNTGLSIAWNSISIVHFLACQRFLLMSLP